MNAAELAKQFHDFYEEMAPTFGYTTREETRTFDVCSKNGMLMIAVCQRILASLAQGEPDYRAMLNWLGNLVLACDYGDNDAPGEQIGWRIRADLLRGPNGERQPAFMYGKSFGEAIRNAMEHPSLEPSTAGTTQDNLSDGNDATSQAERKSSPAVPTAHAESPSVRVPRERTYDQRANALIAFNQCSGDLDDKLEAAYQAELAAAPQGDSHD